MPFGFAYRYFNVVVQLQEKYFKEEEIQAYKNENDGSYPVEFFYPNSTLLLIFRFFFDGVCSHIDSYNYLLTGATLSATS